jgi:hypothetical protein
MPEEFKINDAIGSYRNFYINDKIKIKKLDWKKNPKRKPNWVL